MKRLFYFIYYKWKYRFIDPNVCCCGQEIDKSDGYNCFGCCRSAQEYTITCAMKDKGL